MKYFLFFLLVLVAYGSNAQKFSELIQNEAVEEAKSVFDHPLYVELGVGTLPLEKFKVLVQQDDIYVVNYLKFFGALARQESEPSRKAVLEGYENEADYWEKSFNKYYDSFGFGRTEYISPSTHSYNKLHNNSAANEHISTSLAAAVPCFTLWHTLGLRWGEMANLSANPDHPYKLWIENNLPADDSIVKFFLDFVDGYFERLGEDYSAKTNMLKAYRLGVKAELDFAEGNYKTAFEEKFSVMAASVIPDTFLEAIYHPLYMRMAGDKLALDTFKVLIQQDELYMRAFYQAFEIMAAKENDPTLKGRLTKNNGSMVEFLQWHYDTFEFQSTEVFLPTTKEYAESIVRQAELKPISEGLASLYACYTVWNKMGIVAGVIADLEQNQNHTYKYFIEYNDPYATNSTSLYRMSALIDGYYERLGDNVAAKNQMFQVYELAISHELGFAEGIFSLIF